MPEYRQPLFGSDGEPCGSCGSPLASDQRYCLSCGARRGEARLPFRDILERQSGPATQLTPAGYGVVPPGGGVNEHLRRNAPLMALVGILLLALLIGVLLGHWAGEAPPTAAVTPRPQVIQVGTPATATAAPTPTATTPAAPTETTAKEKKTSSDSKEHAEEPAAAPPKTKGVEELEKATGKDAVKAAEKLPKTFSTGGKPPPKDDKPAAGGADFEEIG